jgi:hypothetical protein
VKGPTTVKEFMALPVVGLCDEETYLDPRTGITHHRRVARKASALTMTEDTIFSVTEPNGDMWVLHGEGRRRMY